MKEIIDLESVYRCLGNLPVTNGIIDFDGVIVDSEPIHELSYKLTLEKVDVYGDNLNFNDLIGKNEITIWTEINKKYNLNRSFDELHKIRMSILQKAIISREPNWFIQPILNYFKERGGAILVSSGNGRIIQKYLKEWKLQSFFKVMFMSTDLRSPINKHDVLRGITVGEASTHLIVEDTFFYAAECMSWGAHAFWVKHHLNERYLSEALSLGIDGILITKGL